MVQYCTDDCEAISDVLVSEGEHEYFVNGGKKNFSESLVGTIVLVEESGGSVEIIAKFGDFDVSAVSWDNRYRAGVYGHDKRYGK